MVKFTFEKFTIYYNCKNAKNIREPRFGLSNSFQNCPNITTVIFGDSVRKVPDYAFSRVYSLKNVVFSNSIDTIGNSSFEETAIENLVLSNSVKYIALTLSTNHSFPLPYAKKDLSLSWGYPIHTFQN